MRRLPFRIVHYGTKDPRTATGGVEAFARNLGLIFERVDYMTPRQRDVRWVVENRIPVVCDNHLVTDWPAGYPVIGFQHGVAAVKAWATRAPSRVPLALAQWRAARRPNTIWVACAEWISRTFAGLFGNRAEQVIYHPVDVERFDGALENEGSRLVLHDARAPHKGSRLVPALERALPGWRFEPLACRPDEVPDRMREARAFLHLSRYEGNSIVCNEAMAMDLPCLLTDVGLMRDRGRPTDVYTVRTREVFRDEGRLVAEVKTFLDSLATRRYHPRRWVLEQASREVCAERWGAVMETFQAKLGAGARAGAAAGG